MYITIFKGLPLLLESAKSFISKKINYFLVIIMDYRGKRYPKEVFSQQQFDAVVGEVLRASSNGRAIVGRDARGYVVGVEADGKTVVTRDPKSGTWVYADKLRQG